MNHDLEEIATAYETFKKCGELQASEYIFSIKKSDIKDHININPQHYSPKLNLAIERVLEFDSKDGWAVTTVGQLEAGIKIYIGPRWNSSNIKVDNPDDSLNLIPYLTANGALELRRFTVKWFDVSKASRKQKEYMEMLRVQEGDILITRSGTIGKVTYATKDLATNYLVSVSFGILPYSLRLCHKNWIIGSDLLTIIGLRNKHNTSSDTSIRLECIFV